MENRSPQGHLAVANYAPSPQHVIILVDKPTVVILGHVLSVAFPAPSLSLADTHVVPAVIQNPTYHLGSQDRLLG